MKQTENLQPSSSNKKRVPGLICGTIKLIEEVNTTKHRWKVQCLKCGHIYEISNSTISSYVSGKTQKCKKCPIERNSKYKIGDIYSGVKIVAYHKQDCFILECLNCGRQFEASNATLLTFVNKTENEYQYCSYCKPKSRKSRKYHSGEIIGNCYELVSFIGGNTWVVKCIKCGKEQQQSIPNLKKHKKDTCFYCEHPDSNKSAFNRTRLDQMSVDERIYYYYKNNVERNNNQPGAKQKPFELTLDQYTNLIHSNCHYCGAPPTSDNVWNKSGKRKCDDDIVLINGVDRIDSNKGYTIDNCVSCCPMCNRMKLDFSLSEFYQQIEKIYLKRLNDQSKDVESSDSKWEAPKK